jgi:hypothetical protein
MTAPLHPDLVRLGDALEQAARRDLDLTPAIAPATAAGSAPGRRRPRRRRVVLGGLLAAVVLIPAAAVAADHLISTDEVAASMPAGTLSLAGREPTCTVVRKDVEFHCVLQRPPAPEVEDWKGTVEPTVDATKHVNGGCRSLVSDGTEWECYLGQEAVRQQIVSDGFLGEEVEGPGRG